MVIMLFDSLYPDDIYCIYYNVERVDPGVVVFKDGNKKEFDSTIFDWEVVEND